MAREQHWELETVDGARFTDAQLQLEPPFVKLMHQELVTVTLTTTSAWSWRRLRFIDVPDETPYHRRVVTAVIPTRRVKWARYVDKKP